MKITVKANKQAKPWKFNRVFLTRLPGDNLLMQIDFNTRIPIVWNSETSSTDGKGQTTDWGVFLHANRGKGELFVELKPTRKWEKKLFNDTFIAVVEQHKDYVYVALIQDVKRQSYQWSDQEMGIL